MSIGALRWIVMVGCGLLLVTAEGRSQNLPFNESFSDGNPTDGVPVKWTPLGGYANGTFAVSDGNYQLIPNTNEDPLVAVATPYVTRDASVRSQVRATGPADGVSILARLSGPGAYQGGIDTDGLAYIGWNDPTYHDLVSVQTPYRPSQHDVTIQFDVIGSQLNLFVWSGDAPRPESPLLSVVDNRYGNTGQIGLLNDPKNKTAVAFRYVLASQESIPVPEPSGVVIIMLGGICTSLRLRRQRRHSALLRS
ncbi:MAG: hypothetical protein U0795_21275 [Pirellulales bacterium]